MKKIICVLLCMAMALSLLAGCRADTQEAYIPTGDALVMEGEEDTGKVQTDDKQQLSLVYYPYNGMNPINSTDYTNRVIFPLVYQGLFSVSRDNEVVPILCQSYTASPDLRSYEFTVDPRATFSDGTQLTAWDVANSLHIAWGSSAYYSGRMQHVQSIYAVSDSALVINLHQACENLPMLLDIPVLKAAEGLNEYPLGSGPYVFSGTEGNRYLSRRASWWCESDDLLITAQRIPLLEAANPTEVRDYFEFGEAGVVCTDPGSDRYVEYRCDYELWDCETGMFVYVGFNLGSYVFQHVGMRQAVIKGIDRAALAEKYYRGFAKVAQLPASPDSPYYSEALAQNYTYNETEFVNLVTSHGVQGHTVRLLVNSGDSLRVKVAQEIGRMLNTSGLIVSVEAVNGDIFAQRLSSGDYDLYLAQTKLSPNMDLSAFFTAGGALAYGGLPNINQLTLCLQALENSGNYYSLHQTVMDQALICPLLMRDYAVYAARGLLTQLQPARDNLFFHTVK